jgi:hypothetical protein
LSFYVSSFDPQRLKPPDFFIGCGTAEAVP